MSTDTMNTGQVLRDGMLSIPSREERNTQWNELHKELEDAGLFHARPMYYTWVIFRTAMLMAAWVVLIVLVDFTWWQISLLAAYTGFWFVQGAFVVHDNAHDEIFKGTHSRRNKAVLAYALILLLGFSNIWWESKHNKHHENPNHLGKDNDVVGILMSYATEQAIEKRGALRLFAKHQAFYFYGVLLLFVGLLLRVAGIGHTLLSGRGLKDKGNAIEFSLILLHLGGSFAFFALMLPWHQALLFVVVQYMVAGFYFGSVFAPNHKGAWMLDADSPQLNYMWRQIITATDIRPNLVVDFFYGGLNHQVAHHLRRNMPRCSLGEAQQIVARYCATHAIPYYQVSLWQSFVKVFSHFQEVSAPLREKTAKQV